MLSKTFGFNKQSNNNEHNVINNNTILQDSSYISN